MINLIIVRLYQMKKVGADAEAERAKSEAERAKSEAERAESVQEQLDTEVTARKALEEELALLRAQLR